MAFDRPVEEFELNDFFIATLKHLSKREPADVVTPRHPMFKRLEKVGNIETRPPSHTYAEEIFVNLPDKHIMISRDDDMKERDYTPVQVATQAKYEPVQRIDTLTIPKFEYDNNKGAKAIADIVARKKKMTDKATRSGHAGVLWNGITVGSSHVFGINEVVRYDPTTEHANGLLGKIACTGNNTAWRAKSRNFNSNYATVSSGHYDATNFLERNANSLLQLWMDVTSLDTGDMDTGQPDLFPMNETLYKYFAALVDQKVVFNDSMNKRDLGVSVSIHWRGMDCFYDSSISVDPNNSAYGTGKMLNMNSFAWTWTEGLKDSWGDMQKLSKTGYAWDRSSQFCIVWKNPAQNGSIWGVQDISVS
jgi:hypothetical protein